MILILDNFDSFTFNLAHYFEEAGAEVLVRRNNMISVDEARSLKPSLICLSPGPGRPEEAGVMPALISSLIGKVPLFGVCLGHQAIAQHFGAKVVPAPALMHGKTSQMEQDQSRLFAGLPSPLEVCRYHSLCVDEATIGPELKITARSEDGVVMALEAPKHAAIGVQFHPEALLTSAGKTIIENALSWSKEAALLC